MRKILSLFILIHYFSLHAEQFTVFEKEGLYGLKNEEGEVTVPPIYKQIGWSDGSSEVLSGVIGIVKNKKWGLITVRNKPLTEVIYHSLKPFDDATIKASVKGKFSNQLFYGLLNKSGQVIISFNYFSLDHFDSHYLVSNYDSRSVKNGLISRDERILVPLKYKSIEKKGIFYFASSYSAKINLYKINGTILERGIDSAQQTQNGIICYKEGFAGFFDSLGNKKEAFDHKKIDETEGVVLTYPFPQWEVIKDNKAVLSIKADSLRLTENQFWVAYNNGAHHFALSDSIFKNSNYEIMAIHDDHLVVRNSLSKKWNVLSEAGNLIISDYDSIQGNSDIYWVRDNERWQLLGRYGKKKSRLTFDVLKEGVDGQFMCKSNEYWGIISQIGLDVSPFKYDSIASLKHYYKAKYLNRWGIMDVRGDWVLKPEFAEVFSFGDFAIGRKGFAYTYAYGENNWKSTSRPVALLDDNRLIIQDESGLLGLLNDKLKSVVSPAYNKIESFDNYLILYADSTCSILDLGGGKILIPSDNVEQVKDFGEGYFLAKKNGRWGFLDSEGRMRISNRYEDAHVFSEGLAPIKLRGNWGFIDKQETLVIQPFYDSVSTFKNGLSIVEVSGKKGLINREGKEVVSVSWDKLEVTKHGSFIVMNENRKYGLISGKGQFLLRPDFDFIEDKGDRVIVTKNNKKGILLYSGKELYKIKYEEIKISKEYTLLKY